MRVLILVPFLFACASMPVEGGKKRAYVVGSAVACQGACIATFGEDGRPSGVTQTAPTGVLIASAGLTENGADVLRTIARITGAVLIADIVADAWEAVTDIRAKESVSKDAVNAISSADIPEEKINPALDDLADGVAGFIW